MATTSVEQFNKRPQEEQFRIFCEGIPIGERKGGVTKDGESYFSWARQVDHFYVIQKHFWGRKEFVAVTDTKLIEPYLESFHINWYALGIMKDEDLDQDYFGNCK